jgi:hypothetical protein
MWKRLWPFGDREQRLAAEERARAQEAEVLELERAIAEDHRRRDQIEARAERGYVRQALGLRRPESA